MVEIYEERFCDTRTNIERKIASRDTTIVKNPNGYGSNGLTCLMYPKFIATHPAKNITWKIKKGVEPQMDVKSSAICVRNERDRNDFASKDFICCFLVSVWGDAISQVSKFVK